MISITSTKMKQGQTYFMFNNELSGNTIKVAFTHPLETCPDFLFNQFILFINGPKPRERLVILFGTGSN